LPLARGLYLPVCMSCSWTNSSILLIRPRNMHRCSYSWSSFLRSGPRFFLYRKPSHLKNLKMHPTIQTNVRSIQGWGMLTLPVEDVNFVMISKVPATPAASIRAPWPNASTTSFRPFAISVESIGRVVMLIVKFVSSRCRWGSTSNVLAAVFLHAKWPVYQKSH
jgi:hypothetical protein